MGSGKVIVRAIEKHGVENFQKEILEHFEDAAKMYEREKEVVTDEFLARDDTYNLRRGGNGGFDFINKDPRSSEWKERAGLASSVKYKILYETDETVRERFAEYRSRRSREKMAETLRKTNQARRGIPLSTETKAKIKIARQGKQVGNLNSQYGSFWITDGLISKKCAGEIPSGWRRGRT
jgi:hypothetical protein